MSSRVDNRNQEAQRLQQQRQQQEARTKKAGDSEAFKQMMANQQTDANKNMATQKQADAGRNVNQNALLARQGIQGKDFAGMLNKQGSESLKQGSTDTKSRTDQKKDTEEARNQKDTKLDNERVDRQGDKLAAISRDDRQNSGGGERSMEGGDQNLQQQEMAKQLDGTAQTEGKLGTTAAQQAAQAGQAGKIPQAVMDQIVERVMVGVNEEGLSQFHIDLKGDMFGGTSMQITADKGKISAKFNTRDVNLGRLLKASEGELARAFSAKGLSLESLEVENA